MSRAVPDCHREKKGRISAGRESAFSKSDRGKGYLLPSKKKKDNDQHTIHHRRSKNPHGWHLIFLVRRGDRTSRPYHRWRKELLKNGKKGKGT